MGPSLHFRNKGTVQTIDTQMFSTTKEGKNGFVNKIDYGNSILEFSSNCLRRLFRNAKNNEYYANLFQQPSDKITEAASCCI